MLDWIAMGNRGANKLPGMSLLLRYFAELFEIDLIRDLFIKLKIIHPFSKFIKKFRRLESKL